MASRKIRTVLFLVALVSLAALPVTAQSFRVQCPTSTITHPDHSTGQLLNSSEPQYNAPTALSVLTHGYMEPTGNINGAIKCQQLSGGDGFATMADGTQTYLFAFGPLSGISHIANGQAGSEFPNVFNTVFPGTLVPGDPATTLDGGGTFTYNGAVGLAPDLDNGNAIDGHVDPRQIEDVAVMNGNMPGPLMAIDEDDEFFLTLTNVGMIMRPDLFEQHTVHFHGYPNASALYDGVPDASVAINIGGSFTYYYLAPDAGTYFWHCHITPPEHLQMGMVGQLYVRPRQNRVQVGQDLYAALQKQQGDLRTACRRPGDGVSPPVAVGVIPDFACSNPVPAIHPSTAITRAATGTTCNGGILANNAPKYAYNDGDGSTCYDVELPLQMHGFDPNFHFVGMTFNPEAFVDMKDKYFLLNGRSYPDTVNTSAMETQTSDGRNHLSQPMPAVVTMTAGQRALLRIACLDVSEYQTLASLGIRMHVIGYNAKLLRDEAGHNLDYYTNSITLAGGESLDVILDSTGVAPHTVFYLYTPQLDHLSNDAENFGGLMTEVHVN